MHFQTPLFTLGRFRGPLFEYSIPPLFSKIETKEEETLALHWSYA